MGRPNHRRSVRISGCIYIETCTPLVFAANSGNDTVTAYTLDTNGDSAPVRTIAGPHTGLKSPSDLAVNGEGELYVVNSGANSVTVYAPGADGDVAPIRTIAGSLTTLAVPGFIAFDGSGDVFVTSGNYAQAPMGVLKFDSDANGNVTPLFAIPMTPQGHYTLGGVALDWHDNVFIGYEGVDHHEIRVFPPGSTTPLGSIGGTMAGLEPTAITVRGGRVFASSSYMSTITAYPTNAPFATTPSLQIAGAATQLNKPVGFEFAEDGRYFVANSGNDSIVVLAPAATGNVAPVQAIAGAHTGLSQPKGIAIGF